MIYVDDIITKVVLNKNYDFNANYVLNNSINVKLELINKTTNVDFEYLYNTAVDSADRFVSIDADFSDIDEGHYSYIIYIERDGDYEVYGKGILYKEIVNNTVQSIDIEYTTKEADDIAGIDY